MKYYAPYSFNDGGKSETTYSDESRDCVVRAIAIAGQIPYTDAHDLVKWHGRKDGHATYHAEHLIDSLFPHCRLEGIAGMARCQWTLGQFLKQKLPGRFICRKRGHLFAVVDAIVYDLGTLGLKTKLTHIWKVG